MTAKKRLLLSAALGVIGFGLRWVQQGIFDPQTGLPQQNAPISLVMAAYLAAVAALAVWMGLRAKKERLEMEDAFRIPPQQMLMPLVCATMLLVAGGALLVMEGMQTGTVTALIQGAGGVIAGGSLLLGVMRWRREERCENLLLIPVWCAVAWLVAAYWPCSSHPVQALFYVQILALAAVVYALFQVASCANGQGSRRLLRFSLPLAVVLSITALADDLPLGMMALYVGCVGVISAFMLCEKE